MSKVEKIHTLMDTEGYEPYQLGQFIEEECMGMGMRVGVPSICMNDGCDYVIDMEPDQDAGWCDECKTNSVKSALILAGII